MARKKGVMQDIPASFLRGAIATGIVSAVQDKRSGADLFKSAMLGGTALSTAVTIEDLLFNKEWKMGKKNKVLGKSWGKGKKAWKKNDAGGINMAMLEQMMQRNNQGLLGNLTASQQLLTGILIGAGATWLLGDEKVRGKLMKSVMQLYTGMVGGFEEIKEQMSDIQAELEAEQMRSE